MPVLAEVFSTYSGAWFLSDKMFMKNLLESKNIIKICLTVYEQ